MLVGRKIASPAITDTRPTRGSSGSISLAIRLVARLTGLRRALRGKIAAAGPGRIRALLLAQVGGLFGTTDDCRPDGRRSAGAYLMIASALAALAFLRRPDMLLNPQFYAEDGTIFFRDQLVYGFWGALANFYNGFPYLLHRIVAGIAPTFGIARIPLIYNLAALTVSALASAWFALPHYRHLVRSDALRILFCAMIVALPGAREITGTLTNMHWFLGIWAFLLPLMQLPRSRWGLGLLVIAFGVILLTAPIAVIAAPLWALRLLHALASGHRREGVALALALGLTMAALILNKVKGVNGSGLPEPLGALRLIAMRIVSEAMLGKEGTLRLGGLVGHGIVHWVAAGTVVAVFALAAMGRFRGLAILFACLYGIVASVLVTLFGRVNINQASASLDELFTRRAIPGVGDLEVGERYFVLGIVLVYLAIFVTLDRLRGAVVRTAATTILLGLFTLVFANGFSLPPFADLNWPDYAGQLAAKLEARDRRPLEIPINPPGWTVSLDLGPRSSEIYVIPGEAMGGLTADREFSQTFVAQCSSLNLIALHVATYGRENIHPLHFVLVNTDSNTVMVERTVAARYLADNSWTSVVFDPLPDSLNHHYRIVLTSPAPDPAEAFTVWRSTGESYPLGEAAVNGLPAPKGADLVFRYACAR